MPRQEVPWDPSIPDDLRERIIKHLQKTIGPIQTTGVVYKYASSRTAFFRFLLCSTVSRLFRYPDQAFAALDFTGKGYIEATDVWNHALVYSTPLSKQELRAYCETHVFAGGHQHMGAEAFRKFFYQHDPR